MKNKKREGMGQAERGREREEERNQGRDGGGMSLLVTFYLRLVDGDFDNLMP